MPDHQTLTGYLPLAAAAAQADLPPSKLRHLAATQQIDATKIGGRWLIHESGLGTARDIISQSTRQPGQGTRIEQQLLGLRDEIEILQGAVDHIGEQIQQLGNLVVLRIHGAEAAHQHGVEVIDGTGRISTIAAPPLPDPAAADDDAERYTETAAAADVEYLADQITADAGSAAAMRQVEQADRDLRTYGHGSMIH